MVPRFFLACLAILSVSSSVRAFPVDLGSTPAHSAPPGGELEANSAGMEQSAPLGEGPDAISAEMEQSAPPVDGLEANSGGMEQSAPPGDGLEAISAESEQSAPPGDELETISAESEQSAPPGDELETISEESEQSAPPGDELETISAGVQSNVKTTPKQTAKPSPVSPLTSVKLTYYWLAYQPATDKGNVELRSCDGKQLFGKASLNFARKLRMEGSGHLANGKMLNLGGCNCADGTDTFNCFIDITKQKNAPFGYGVRNIPLNPFVSVANNDRKQPVGRWLYAPDFDGVKLPNGKVHNGCLQKVDHIGRGGRLNHIDVFALTESIYRKTFIPQVKKSKIKVEWGSPKCGKNKRKGYGITPKMTFN